ncbi:MAG TPA: uracil-DNA glycosylase [Gammaproteobacteria bacterium]|jgi:DNA polymerase|nr:uracil-DNA glycosylase [Gammaproteobacteria bacterium]
MQLTKFDYLNAMGILSWQLKSSHQDPSLPKPQLESLAQLKNTVAACTACALHQSRTQTVFGVGNPNATLMIIGEAPGFYEDQKGEPFVGRAGQLLNAMLQSIGLTREEVFIANILKCRPPNNRDPIKSEVAECTPYLEKQIALIQPKLLLALGRIAAHYLLNSTASLNQIRGKILSFGERQTPLIVTYHPAYLLRTPRDKGKAFQDLHLVLQNLNIKEK